LCRASLSRRGMQQLIHDLRTGKVRLLTVPEPGSAAGTLVTATRRSLVSAGTERMLIEFGRAGWLQKARQQPHRVREVLNKARTDGFTATVEAVRAKLDWPMPMGYSNVGRVLEVGRGVGGYSVGDRVVSNGPHADVVRVPRNLCAKIPADVSDDHAAFAVLGAIALHGVRLATPSLGEMFAVTGLGLVGLLTVQLLRAHGCRVLGIDLDRGRLELAERFGAETVNLSKGEDPLVAAEAFSRGRGMDGVILALASASSEPVGQAARMCRKRGRIVLVGVTGLELSRSDFYEKEISFQVSCSYGPGRYDPSYEESGQDYPVAFVRWTAQRNFEAVLDMLAGGEIDVAPLISHRFPFEEAPAAYDLLDSDEPSLGILLEYQEREEPGIQGRTTRLPEGRSLAVPGAPRVSFIGAGNYASKVLAPAFAGAGARFRSIASSAGPSGAYLASKYGFQEATTETARLFDDVETDVIVVATPHDTHAGFASMALQAGKHVFVEKPLAISREGLDQVAASHAAATESGVGPILMVGFNRRFAPHVVQAREMLAAIPGPRALIMTVNAGAIPSKHWAHDPDRGGGRIVGEACHFVDLLRHLAGAPIEGWDISALRRDGRSVDDVASFTLRFADGSHGTVHYLANGHNAFPKERVEVFGGGRVLQIDNFRVLRAWGWKGIKRFRTLRQDKGQRACVATFMDAVQAGTGAPIPFSELVEVSRVSVELALAARFCEPMSG
jgi:predicted dehydrogenase/threonine dehydrogenase-like Zn-dependent dehydrogenase